MSCHEKSRCVLDDRKTVEEPRLAEENGEDAVVHRIAGKSIETDYDQLFRRIDRRECALTGSEEGPDASEEHDASEENEAGSGQRRNRESRKMEAIRSLENAKGNVDRHCSREENDEEECAQGEDRLHG